MSSSPYDLPPQPAAPLPAPRRPRGRPALGIVALVASCAALVLGGVGVWFAGFSIGRSLRFSDVPDLIDDPTAQMWESLGRVGIAAVILLIAWVVHAGLAVWGLVQGIVAAVTNRGRVFGGVAIGIAAVGWLLLWGLTQEAIVSGLLGIIPFVG